MYEWRFDREFKLTIIREAGVVHIALVGQLDAVTAKNLQRRADLPALHDAQVILDLTSLEAVDTAGVREIRRIVSLYTNCDVRGPRGEVSELLELMPRQSC